MLITIIDIEVAKTDASFLAFLSILIDLVALLIIGIKPYFIQVFLIYLYVFLDDNDIGGSVKYLALNFFIMQIEVFLDWTLIQSMT